MKLIFEKSRPGRGSVLLPPCDVPEVTYDQALLRGQAPRLPEIAEVDLGRHYTELAKQTHGVNDGFYPLGSCTMKYNPKINEEAAALPGFTGVHPLQPEDTVQGCLEVLYTARAAALRDHRHGRHDLPARRRRPRGIHRPAPHQGLPPEPGGHGPAPRSSSPTPPTAPTPPPPPWRASRW